METDNFKNILFELLNSKYDSQPTKNEKYAEQLIAVHDEFVQRNKKLTELLNDYIEQRKKRIDSNNFFKKFIFWFFIALLGLLTLTVVVVFLSVDINDTSITSTVSLLSIAVTYLGSLLSIFKIISEYLFPATEEKDAIEMIKSVISNDIKVEEIMSKAIKENRSYDIEKLREFKLMLDDGILNQAEYDDLKNHLLSCLKSKNN